MKTHKKVTLITILVIVCVTLVCQAEGNVVNHPRRHHDLTLRHHRFKRAPQNPVSTTVRPTSTLSTTTVDPEEKNDDSESGKGFGHTLLNIAKFMIQQVRILIQSIMSN